MALELVMSSVGLMTAFWCLLGFANYPYARRCSSEESAN